jgi:hypothetical protein
MPLKIFTLVAVALICALAASPAQASKVIDVGHGHAVVRDDPFVPASAPEPEPGARAVAARQPPRGYSAVVRSLLLAKRTHKIGAVRYRQYIRAYRKARSVRSRLRGARGAQLGYVIGALESIAVRKRLTSSRLAPLFLTLKRNTQFWPRMPFPSSRGDVTFRGSEIVFRYYVGEGLQIQPLTTFVKANLMHGACVGAVKQPCRKDRLRRLLDEMSTIAVKRGRGFIAWEYFFAFGGGAPPWMSGMAQATGIQALGRAAQLLDRPQYLTTARRALGAFDTNAPLGVRATGFRGGTAYLQYSFAPRLYIFNAFTQAVLGLYDFWKITGDARAQRQYLAAEPELKRQIPFSDVGDWSRYNYRGPESDSSYHELLREVLQSMCSRRLGAVYCTYAKRYEADQTEPPELTLLGPETATAGQNAFVSFQLSKLSAVEITISKDGKTAFHKVATFSRGRRGFTWKPKSGGDYDVRISAKELRTGRGLHARDSGTIAVE